MDTGFALKMTAGLSGQSDLRVRVLVCGEAANSVKSIARLLGEAGFEVVTCQGFSELMDLAEEVRPQLIIIEENDWPWGRGVDLLTLRKISKASVIAVGNSRKQETMAMALNAGADYYMVRPFGRNELLARIRALLRR